MTWWKIVFKKETLGLYYCCYPDLQTLPTRTFTRLVQPDVMMMTWLPFQSQLVSEGPVMVMEGTLPFGDDNMETLPHTLNVPVGLAMASSPCGGDGGSRDSGDGDDLSITLLLFQPRILRSCHMPPLFPVPILPRLTQPMIPVTPISLGVT